MVEQKSLIFKALNWIFKDDDQESYFYVSGISTENGDNSNTCVKLKIKNFKPFCYVELPKIIEWTEKERKELVLYIQRNAQIDNQSLYGYKRGYTKPVTMKYTKKYDLYGEIPKCYLYLEFNTKKDVMTFSYWMIKAHKIPNIKNGTSFNFQAKSFLVHEQNIDPIIHLAYDRKIKLAGWIEVKNVEPEEDEENYWSCDYNDIYLFNSDKILFPKYLSFDFECYSDNHKAKLPDPENPKNVIFHIGVIIGRLGENPLNRKYLLLTLGDVLRCKEIEPLSKEGYMRKNDYRSFVETICFKNERLLLKAFIELIIQEDPDIFIGYNILKFDWHYFMIRAKLNDLTAQMSRVTRIPDLKAEEGKMSWSSSAYGIQEAFYLSVPGRVHVDVIMEMQRNYKFESFSLDNVSKFFLGESKEDVTPTQMFLIWKFYCWVEKCIKNKNDVSIISDDIESSFPLLKTTGFLLDYREKITKLTNWKEIQRASQELLTMTGYYCVIDSVLPIDLIDKLNLWVNMESLSNIMNVPSSYLHLRGTQIKVLAQLYAEAKPKYVIPYNKYSTDVVEKYKGAVVIDAEPGVYEDVDLNDFESLYPSEIISSNICYTTFLNDNLPEHRQIPDSECNILIWSDHVGCECDTTKRKTKIKKENILCKNNRYRFRKVKYIQKNDGSYIIEGEGVMPRLERRLLSERKIVKKEMAKCEAILKMTNGNASQNDIAFYKKIGYEIVEKGSLNKEELKNLEIKIIVLNANQLGLKISSNAAYGGLGAKTGFCPFIPGAASVTAMGRKHLMSSKQFVIDKFGATVIYGDTDSIMVMFKKSDDCVVGSIDPVARANQVVKEITHHLKCEMLGFENDEKLVGIKKFMYDTLPINLQQECRFKKLVLLTKKKYMATIMNKEGKVVDKIKKGTVAGKRGNCAFLKKIYNELSDSIIENKSFDEIQNIILNSVFELVRYNYNPKDLIIYKAIANFSKYAKKQVITIQDEKTGQSKQITEKHYSKVVDDYGVISIGLPTTSNNPLDWYYEKPQAHTCLGLKMLERGDQVPPNTRMEYVFIKIDKPKSKKILQSDKIEDYTFFMENKSNLKIDIPYYIERQLLNPISQLLFLQFGYSTQNKNNLEEDILQSFENLPVNIKLELANKKHLRQKILFYLKNYEIYSNNYKINICNFKNQKSKQLPDELNHTQTLCMEWYKKEKMILYYHQFGVGKGKIKRREKKDQHPLFIDILQTIQRHEQVINKLNILFQEL